MKVINTNQRLLLEKLSLNSNLEMEQRQIDIFGDLPLKNENSLQLLEIKLKHNLFYRNEMISQMSTFY